MTTSISSNTTLNVVFREAIESMLSVDRASVTRLEEQRDTVELRRALYRDIQSNLNALKSAARALISTHSSYAMGQGRTAVVTPFTSGASVLTATAGSDAIPGEYEIVVSKLAKAHSQVSGVQASVDGALGKSGEFWLGGTGTASVSFSPAGALSAVEVADVAEGQRELGSGEYKLEVRLKDGKKQFRLVDADGNAVAINRLNGKGTTSTWQDLTSGELDTGRGFKITLDASAGPGDVSFTYEARGVKVEINAGDSLRDIARKINAAEQTEGREISASIVGKQLVLTAAKTGVNHSLIYTDNVGMGFTGADLVSPQDAEFTVNGLVIRRASNTGLTDVIPGVTLNLSPDAETNSGARLTIKPSADAGVKAVEDFVSKYNTALNHLTSKMAITSTVKDDKTVYNRGPLSGDYSFRSLRFDLIHRLSGSISNAGTLKNLSQIGLTYDDQFTLKLDKTKLQEILLERPDDVAKLLDAVMDQVDRMLGRFTGDSGSLAAEIDSFDEQLETIDSRIETWNKRLADREANLIKQYAALQASLVSLQNQVQLAGLLGLGSTLDMYY